jgi:hypothetical protein
MAQILLALSQSRTIQPSATVAGAAAGAGGLVVLTTSGPHGLVGNDLVQTAGVGGTIEANGQFILVSTTSTTITLPVLFTNAFTSSAGAARHIGVATPAVSIDNTLFPITPVDFQLTARLESLSFGASARFHFEDAIDSAFLTSQPVVTTCVSDCQPFGTSDRIITGAKRSDAPDLRIGASGARLRLKVYVAPFAFASMQFSAWLTI